MASLQTQWWAPIADFVIFRARAPRRAPRVVFACACASLAPTRYGQENPMCLLAPNHAQVLGVLATTLLRNILPQEAS